SRVSSGVFQPRGVPWESGSYRVRNERTPSPPPIGLGVLLNEPATTVARPDSPERLAIAEQEPREDAAPASPPGIEPTWWILALEVDGFWVPWIARSSPSFRRSGMARYDSRPGTENGPPSTTATRQIPAKIYARSI